MAMTPATMATARGSSGIPDDERLVDLDRAGRQRVQQRQGRIAGPEVVDRQLDAGVAELAKLFHPVGTGLEQHGLRQLDPQRLGGTPARSMASRTSCGKPGRPTWAADTFTAMGRRRRGRLATGPIAGRPPG